MSGPRLFFLALCFFLDVHVRADVISSAAGSKTVKEAGYVLNLDRGGVIERRDGGDLHLVSGDLLVESTKTFSLNVPFARLQCQGACGAIFKRADDHLTAISLKGNWTYRRSGDRVEYALPSGLQLRLGEVAPDGMATAEFPQGLPWKETIATWGRLFRGGPKDFKRDVAAFHEVWQEAVEHASQVQAEAAQAAIADHDRALAQTAAAKQGEEAENAQLRALFRQKNQLD